MLNLTSLHESSRIILWACQFSTRSISIVLILSTNCLNQKTTTILKTYIMNFHFRYCFKQYQVPRIDLDKVLFPDE